MKYTETIGIVGGMGSYATLGCTEFPVLLPACRLNTGKTLWDPLDSAIDYIKSVIK